jgi:hypothetical protein
MIPRHERTGLLALIERLEDTTPLSEVDLFYKERLRTFRRSRPDEDQHDYLAALRHHRAAWPIKDTYFKRHKTHPVYGDTDYSLGFQVRAAEAFLDNWFTVGSQLPVMPSANRILAILKRVKEIDLRERFKQAHDRHFAGRWRPPVERAPSGDQKLDWAQSDVPRLTIRLREIEDIGNGKLRFEFDFHCEDCGGTVISYPDDPDEEGPAICLACDQVFGTAGKVKALAMRIGIVRAIELGLAHEDDV